MKRICQAVVWIVIIYLASPVAAADPSPDAFAYGLDLTIEAVGGLNALPLPAHVYNALTRADYGDLQVFNAAGKPVAHTLYTPEAEPPAESWSTVPLFPLPAPVKPDGGGSDIRIDTRQNGAIIRIRPVKGQSANTSEIMHHIIDLSGIETPIDGLRLALQPAVEGRLHNLKVASSKDLAHWRTVVEHASVGALNFLGHQLTRTTVDLPERTYTYLRLTWTTPLKGAKLNAVSVRKPTSNKPLPRETLTLSAHDEKKSPQQVFFHYTATGHRPTDRVRVDLPLAGTLAQITLFSRPDEDAEWRYRYHGLAYHLKHNGARLTNEAIELSATADPHWRIAIQSDPALLSDKPRLMLSWRPHHLVFAANDRGPFRLAYGRANGKRMDSRLDALLQKLKQEKTVTDLPLASAGAPYDLGGPRRLNATAHDWTRYLLWGVMILTVSIIGALAFRLYGQLKATEANAGETNK